MKETQEIINALIKFRNERDWKQFHNPKDLALAINVEAGELLELFLWKNAEDADIEKVNSECRSKVQIRASDLRYYFDSMFNPYTVEDVLNQCDSDVEIRKMIMERTDTRGEIIFEGRLLKARMSCIFGERQFSFSPRRQ